MCYKNHNCWFFCFVLALFSLRALAVPTVNLRWDFSTNSQVTGFHVYSGTASGVYSQMEDVGASTTASLTDLRPGNTYYFVVSAYTASGTESAPSTEISFTLPLDAPPQTVLLLSGSQVTVNIGSSSQAAGISGATVSTVTQPRFGSAVINSDNTVTYTAGKGFTGRDSFGYTLTAPGVTDATGTVYVANQGSFSGLVTNGSPGALDTGMIQVTVGSGDKFTGRLVMGALVAPISGTFDSNGDATAVISWEGIPVVTLSLNLNTTDSQISGSVGVSSSTAPSTVAASLLTYNAVNKAPQVGTYTLLLPPQSNPPAGANPPQGVGYFRVVIGANGSASVVGKLADNTTLAMSGWVAPDGTLSLYRALYASKGFLAGVLKFENISTTGAESDIDGTIVWERPAAATSASYPSGFSTSIDAIGSVYTTSTNSILALVPAGQKKAMVSLQGSTLASPVSDQVSLVGSNVLKESSATKTRLAMQVNPATGIFAGSFIDPTTGKVSPVGGAVFQKRALGAGSFFLSAKSGSVLVENSNSGSP